MMAAVARAVMALAVRCLGDHRQEWALAMRAELEAAIEDGKPLAFALGCLAGAWREMPAHNEGRFVLANYALAIGLIIPLAALLISDALLGFPYLYEGHVGAPGLLMGRSEQGVLVTDANRAAVPSLIILVFLLGAGHLRIAWVMLDRDWARVAVTGTLNAAATATLVIFMGVLFRYDTRVLMEAAALAIELTAISALARWHAQLHLGAPPNSPAHGPQRSLPSPRRHDLKAATAVED